MALHNVKVVASPVIAATLTAEQNKKKWWDNKLIKIRRYS